MINLANNTSIVADNKVAFCGLEYLLTDKEAQQLKGILDGMISSRSTGGSIVASSQTPVKTGAPSTSQPKAESAEKAPYVHSKDFKPVYEVKELTGEDGTKLHCVCRKNGWTSAEKKLANAPIKAFLGQQLTIETEVKSGKNKGAKKSSTDTMVAIKVGYTDKNGKARSYDAWGFKNKAHAEYVLGKMPTVITVAELNKESH